MNLYFLKSNTALNLLIVITIFPLLCQTPSERCLFSSLPPSQTHGPDRRMDWVMRTKSMETKKCWETYICFAFGRSVLCCVSMIRCINQCGKWGQVWGGTGMGMRWWKGLQRKSESGLAEGIVEQNTPDQIRHAWPGRDEVQVETNKGLAERRICYNLPIFQRPFEGLRPVSEGPLNDTC